MKVLLFGEGNSDVTVDSQERQGAVSILLRKILESSGNSDARITGARWPRIHEKRTTSGFSQKVDAAIALANTRGADAVAIVVDRDGDRKRLGMLQDGRKKAGERVDRPYAALAGRTAIGIAVEMLEAWLIADAGALSAVVNGDGAMPDPESLRNPKEKIDELLDDAGVSVAEGYDAIAEQARLDELERRCPAFRNFAREVQEHLLSPGA